MWKVLDRALGALDKVVQALCVLCLTVVTFAVSWQVIARYVTKSSSSWTSELATLAFVWLTMLAIAIGVRHGRHMVLDIWEYLPRKRWVRNAVSITSGLLILGTLLTLLYFGWMGVPSAMARNMPGLGLPFGLNSLAVPFGCALAAVFSLEATVRLLVNRDPDADPLPSKIIFQSPDEQTVKGEI